MRTKEKKNKSEDGKKSQAAAQSRELEQPSISQTKKQHIHTDAGFRRRIIALAVITGILFLVFLIRLVQFQLVDGSKYRTQAERGRPVSASQRDETAPGSLAACSEAKLNNILS